MRYRNCRLLSSVSLFISEMNRHAVIWQAMQPATNAIYVQNVANVLHKPSAYYACSHDPVTLT